MDLVLQMYITSKTPFLQTFRIAAIYEYNNYYVKEEDAMKINKTWHPALNLCTWSLYFSQGAVLQQEENTT